MRLTQAGRAALPHARASLAHAERAQSAAQRASGVDAGELHVGTLYSVSVGVLPGALQTWRLKYPDVQVRLIEFRRSDDLVAAMQAGRAGLAVGPTPDGWEGPIQEIGAEEFVIAAAPGSQLPGDGQTVALVDLAESRWVHFTPPSGLGDILNEACSKAGFEPRAAVRTEQAPSALNLARAGLGIALVPGNIAPPEYDGVVARVEPPIQRPLSVYTRVRPDPITAALVEAISNEALTNPPHVQQLIGAST